MADILFLAHRLPYPPDRGDRVRSWHILNALAKLGTVDVCALVDSEADLKHVAMVESVAETVTVVVRQSSRIRASLRSLISRRPASVEAFIDPDLMRIAHNRARNAKVIYAFSGQMAAYVPKQYGGRFVMDFVDMDSAKFAAMGLPGRIEAHRLLAWEVAAAKRADVSLFVSENEAQLFESKTGLTVSVLEGGIDVAHFAPDMIAAEPAPQPLIVFTGQMDYRPNVEAVTTFAQKHLPAIRAAVPAAHFAIVGRAPTASVRALASPYVTVTGQVSDTRSWLAAAAVVVAPMTIARGVQTKVLEGMAMARPCVVSPGAAQGINAVAGRDFVIAEHPVDDIIGLLSDPLRADAIGQSARRRMREGYSWDAQLAPLAQHIRL